MPETTYFDILARPLQYKSQKQIMGETKMNREEKETKRRKRLEEEIIKAVQFAVMPNRMSVISVGTILRFVMDDCETGKSVGTFRTSGELFHWGHSKEINKLMKRLINKYAKVHGYRIDHKYKHQTQLTRI